MIKVIKRKSQTKSHNKSAAKALFDIIKLIQLANTDYTTTHVQGSNQEIPDQYN